jgi:hypothetical protein
VLMLYNSSSRSRRPQEIWLWGGERDKAYTHHPGRRRLYVVFHIFFKSRHHAPFFQVDQSAVNVIATRSLIWESSKQDAPGPESKGL